MAKILSPRLILGRCPRMLSNITALVDFFPSAEWSLEGIEAYVCKLLCFFCRFIQTPCTGLKKTKINRLFLVFQLKGSRDWFRRSRCRAWRRRRRCRCRRRTSSKENQWKKKIFMRFSSRFFFPWSNCSVSPPLRRSRPSPGQSCFRWRPRTVQCWKRKGGKKSTQVVSKNEQKKLPLIFQRKYKE